MSAAEKIWPDVMDLNTAAAYLSYHPVTMREWKRLGKGPPGRKVGGRWRFLKSALDAYLTGTKPPTWPANLPPTSSSHAARTASCGSGSPRPADSRYLEALGLPTAPLRPNGRRGSTPNTTE